MIKKILYILGFLMFASAVVQPIVAIGADEPKQFSGDEKDVPFSTARLFSKVADKISFRPGLDWGEGFGTSNEADVGKNLYMMIYDKTQNQPITKAMKNVAGKYGMPEGDLNLILHGDYSKMLDKKPGMTQDEAYRKVAEIQQLYKQQKDMQELEANIKAAVEPSEIFANGDTGDSGFDLINDLSIIEKILFLKSNPIDVGKAYNSATTDNSAEKAPPTPPASGPVASTPKGGGSVTVPGGEKTGTSSSPVTSGGSATTPLSGKLPSGTSSPATTAEVGVNPNSCFSNHEFMDALKNFEIKASIDPNYKDHSQVSSDNTSAKSPSSSAGSSGSGGDNTGASPADVQLAKDDFLPAKSPPPSPPVQPAPADNWKNSNNWCAGTFCITVNFVKKPAESAFKSSDNCIACHAEKINDILKKVVNHTLSPSKVPGNLGESAKCKKAVADAFGAVSMNFYAISMPVKTPVNDDLVYGTNIEDDWYNYCSAVSFPFGCQKKDPPKTVDTSQYKIPPSVTETVTGKSFSNTSDSTSQADLINDIQMGINSYSLQRNTDSSAYDAGKGADKSLGLYNPLKVELNNMSAYFGTIRDILHSLHEKVDTVPGGQACTGVNGLNNKKECS